MSFGPPWLSADCSRTIKHSGGDYDADDRPEGRLEKVLEDAGIKLSGGTEFGGVRGCCTGCCTHTRPQVPEKAVRISPKIRLWC